MRYNLEKKKNRFATRTLQSFSRTMFDLLETKSLETIMVSELCQLANYPRATFYNYFQDKYDLLDYCWSTLKDQVHLQDVESIPENERIYEIFGRVYDFFDDHKDRLLCVLRHNALDGELFTSFQQYMRNQTLHIMEQLAVSETKDVPQRILAQHYCNTMMLVLEHCFLRSEYLSKRRAVEILRLLLPA